MTDQVETIRDTATAQYAAARNNPDLSADAKRRLIAQAYTAAKTALDKLQADGTATTDARRDALSRKLYGIPNTADPSAMISYRDAQDRASRLGEVSEAILLLNRAQTSGDDLLVRALLEQGYDNKWADVINAYIAKNPTNESAAEELWDIVRTVNASAFTTYLAYVAPVPPELANLSAWKISDIAAGNTQTSQQFA